jgi:hypothetical protein
MPTAGGEAIGIAFIMVASDRRGLKANHKKGALRPAIMLIFGADHPNPARIRTSSGARA